MSAAYFNIVAKNIDRSRAMARERARKQAVLDDAKRGQFTAISLHQPHASAVALGLKAIETRGWLTWHTGPIAIHAAKKWNLELSDLVCDLVTTQLDVAEKFAPFYVNAKVGYQFPLGCIVAIAELAECVRADMLNTISPLERALGCYEPPKERYGWILRNVKPLPKPFPCKGRQGLFRVTIPTEFLP